MTSEHNNLPPDLPPDRPAGPAADALDAATRARLAKLAGVPVDTSRVARRLRTEMVPARARSNYRFRRWGPATGAAAGLAAAVVLVVLLTGNSPAVAGPDDLANVHREIVSGRTHVMTAQTMDEASRMLAQESASTPAMPRQTPGQVMSCCECEVCGQHVAAVGLACHGQPVTMMVARCNQMKCRGMSTVVRDGQSYMVGHSAGLTMVMQQRGGSWLCLVGNQTQDALIALARGVAF